MLRILLPISLVLSSVAFAEDPQEGPAPDPDDGDGEIGYEQETTVDDIEAAFVQSDANIGSQATDDTGQSVDPESDDGPTGGDPVLLSTGELLHVEKDITVEAPGAARLTFERKYLSRSDDRTALGSNWSHNHDIRIVFPSSDVSSLPAMCRATEESCLIVRRGSNREIFFRPPGSSFYLSLVDSGQQVAPSKDALGRYVGAVIYHGDGTRESFDQDGYIESVFDRHGNWRMYDYTARSLVNEWETLCQYAPTNSSRFCDVVGPSLGLQSPTYKEVTDIGSGVDGSISDGARLAFERLADESMMYPAYSPGYCQGSA